MGRSIAAHLCSMFLRIPLLITFLAGSLFSQSAKLDLTFASVGGGGSAAEIHPLPDGNVLVTGVFSQWGGQPTSGMVLLDRNGHIVRTYGSAVFDNAQFARAFLVDGGAILAVGAFSRDDKFDTIIKMDYDGQMVENYTPVKITANLVIGDMKVPLVLLQPRSFPMDR